MKLQLYQQTIRNGENHEAVFNGSDVAQGILDIRIGSLFALPSTFNDTLTMLSFDDKGYFIYVIKPLFSRIGDYKALVAYVPQQIVRAVSPEIGKVVQAMTDCLSEGKSISNLARFFEKEYQQENMYFGPIKKSNRYACRFYGEGMPCKNLAAVWDASVLQTSYMGYAGVFFMKTAYQEMIRQDAMTDISREPMTKASLSLWLLQNGVSQMAAFTSQNNGGDKKHPPKKKSHISPKLVGGWIGGMLLGGVIGWTTKTLLTDETPPPPSPPVVVQPADSTNVEWEDSLISDTLVTDTFYSDTTDMQI